MKKFIIGLVFAAVYSQLGFAQSSAIVFPEGTYQWSGGEQIKISDKGFMTTTMVAGTYPIYCPKALHQYATRFITTCFYDFGECAVPLKFDVEYFADRKILGLDLTWPTRMFNCSPQTLATEYSELEKIK